jgi:hypothetical protein
MAGEREVIVPYEAACPRCAAGPHAVEVIATLSRGTLLFGGPGDQDTTLGATATVTCPTTGLPFDVTVSVPARAGEHVQSARVQDATAAAPPAAASEDWRAADLAEWRKTSATQARDAAGKLLAAGTAAVGAYFTILKFVGGDAVDGWSRVLASLPAIGYLAVCALAAAALRPVLVRVYGPDDFEQVRETLLVQLNRYLTAGVAVFVAATVLAVVAYLVVWP